MLSLKKQLLRSAKQQDLIPDGDFRLFTFDNDGMGLTGELVIELQLPIYKGF